MVQQLGLWLFASSLLAQQAGNSTFEQKVQPILRANCIACHSEKNITSGLSVETKESIVRGGNRGPVVKTGEPAASILIEAVKQTGALKMPPGRKLNDEQIGVLEQWIKDGLPMPAALLKSKRAGAD